MVIHACGHGLGRILGKGIGGDCKNGNPGRIGMLGSPDAAGSRQAIHDRHLDIHEDSGVESWSRGQKMVDSLLSVAGRRDLEANMLQLIGGDFLVHFVVLGQQNMEAHQIVGGFHCWHRWLRSWLAAVRRQCKLDDDSKAGALSGAALDIDGTMHHGNEILGDGQAEPGTAKLACGAGAFLLKRLEEVLQIGGIHADACIADDKADDAAVFLFLQQGGLQVDTAASRCELHCIGEQIHEDLVQAQAVANDFAGRQLAAVGVELHSFRLRLARKHGVQELQHLPGAEGLLGELHAAAFNGGGIEDIIDDTEQMTGGQCAVIQAVAEVFREGRHCPRDGQIADDRIERCADLMAHAGQEVPLGLAGLPGRVQGIDECLLCFIDIAPEKDETAERMRSGGRDALQGVRIPAPAGGTPDAALQIDLAAFPAQAGK